MDKHLKELDEYENKKKAKPKYQYAKVEADGRVHVNGVDIPTLEAQAQAQAAVGGATSGQDLASMTTGVGPTRRQAQITRTQVTGRDNNMKHSQHGKHVLNANIMEGDDYVQRNASMPDFDGRLRRLTTTAAEDAMNAIPLDTSLSLYVEPEDGYFSEKALAAFVRCNNPSPEVRVHYELSRTDVYIGLTHNPLTQDSNSIGYDDPYIQIDTPFGEGAARILKVQAVFTDAITGTQRKSEIITRSYIVEAAGRPNSYAFLAPGVETGKSPLYIYT